MLLHPMESESLEAAAPDLVPRPPPRQLLGSPLPGDDELFLLPLTALALEAGALRSGTGHTVHQGPASHVTAQGGAAGSGWPPLRHRGALPLPGIGEDLLAK
jgi:hypothetical protein